MSARTKLTTTSKTKEVDYLTEDPLIRDQQVCIMSFVGPNLKQKCDINAFKVRGSYTNQEEAEKKMKQLHKIDPDYDMFIAPVGIWCPFNPNPDEIDSQTYGNDQLNELMKGYQENKMKTNEHYNERKRKMIEDAINEGTEEGQKELASIKEHPIAVKQRMSDLTEQMKNAKENMEKLESQINATQIKLDKDYGEKELIEAEKEFESYKERVRNAESKDALSEIQEELRIKYTEYEKIHNKPTDSTTTNDTNDTEDSSTKTENTNKEGTVEEICENTNTNTDTKTDTGLEKDDPWVQSKSRDQ